MIESLVTKEFYQFAGVFITAALALTGVWYTSKQSSKAAKATATMTEKAIDAAAYERARASYEAAIDNYMEEIDHLRARISVLTSRLDDLNHEVYTMEGRAAAQREVIQYNIERYEAHMEWCSARLARIKDKWEAGLIVDPDDPDLILDPQVP
jgi:predicted  nucleic acid-binding Zn-ribbon protein